MKLTSDLSDKQQELFDSCYLRWKGNQDRGPAEKAWKKLNPSEEDTKFIMNYIIAMNIQNKHEKKARKFIGGFGPFLTQKKWRNELPDVKKGDKTAVKECNCGKPVTSPQNLCTACWEENNPNKWKRNWTEDSRKTGLIPRPDETTQEWQTRCREYGMKRHGLLKKIGG